MTRMVACTPTDFEPIVWSELLRGNSAGPWIGAPQSTPTQRMKYPLDLEAVRAEFDLPECLQVNEFADGRTSIGCELTRTTLGGGPRRRGWWARRAQSEWWVRFEASGRPRVVFAPRPDEES